MPPEVVVGIDAGTTSTKFVAISRDGQIVSSAGSGPIATTSPSPGASVQLQSDIWAALVEATTEGCGGLTAPTRVAGLSLAAQSGSVLPIGEPEAITWMDTRSRDLVARWDSPTRESIRRASGWMPLPGLGLSTISWLLSQNCRPERWASVDDYLAHGLTGRWVTNPSNACGMQLMDIDRLGWSPELCSIAGVDPDSLSTISVAGTRLGQIVAGPSEHPNSLAGVELFAGGHDQAAAALALGVTEPGAAFLSVGTAWVLTIVTDRTSISEVPDEFNLSPHIVPDRWTLSQNLGGLGKQIAPHLGGSDAELHGAFDLCVDQVAATVSAANPICELTELVVVGGATQSPYLLHQLANRLAIPVVSRPAASWPALGAALVAANACGWDRPPLANLPSERFYPND